MGDELLLLWNEVVLDGSSWHWKMSEIVIMCVYMWTECRNRWEELAGVEGQGMGTYLPRLL